MQIAKNTVVQIHYTLKNDAGEVLDTSSGSDPLTYLQGHGNLIPGLEAALEGRSAGEQAEVTVAPEQAYGVRDDELIQEVPRSAFQGVKDIEVGMRFHAGPRTVTVTKVADDVITVDANHPLADQRLHFSVQIVDVRAASAEELSHGHVHGPGGHQH
ncbi:MAG: peptidylprolyl isomerase [Steroidobacteraceae bacterium]